MDEIEFHEEGAMRYGFTGKCVVCKRPWPCPTATYVTAIQQGRPPCPKCEGRGFIRTEVDGQRDSEPCSFCLMSGKGRTKS